MPNALFTSPIGPPIIEPCLLRALNPRRHHRPAHGRFRLRPLQTQEDPYVSPTNLRLRPHFRRCDRPGKFISGLSIVYKGIRNRDFDGSVVPSPWWQTCRLNRKPRYHRFNLRPYFDDQGKRRRSGTLRKSYQLQHSQLQHSQLQHTQLQHGRLSLTPLTP